ncbi:HesA/MoeB/ThiF family protein [Desulfovibrio cuneatus]|uniref:HesA/MoeB/ThiF family protein n=1 Tax=Desulfovibrio cuneatus TaxID=159728 RepID=UPI00041925DB|nr:ThiF family adenylyltransferase [Desulfovibrio cuneatus]
MAEKKHGSQAALAPYCAATAPEDAIQPQPSCHNTRHSRSLTAYADITDASPEECLHRLATSRVVLLGCGGLGGHVLEGLARAGVGFLRVVDGDTFSPSNLNRQTLCTEHTLGQNKALAAQQRAAAINSEIDVEAVTTFATPATLPGLLQGMHVVVDALDNVAARFQLAEAACTCGIPVVHGAVAGFSGHATVVYPGDTSLHSIYATNQGEAPNSPNTMAGATEAPGVAPPTPALIAAVQVAETIKILLGKPELTLRNRLFLCDLGRAYAQVLHLT